MHKLKYLRYLCSGEAFLPLGSKMERPWLLLLGSLIDTTCWRKWEMCKYKQKKRCKIWKICKIWKMSSRLPVGQSAGRLASRGSSCIPSATQSSPMEAVVHLAAALTRLYYLALPFPSGVAENFCPFQEPHFRVETLYKKCLLPNQSFNQSWITTSWPPPLKAAAPRQRSHIGNLRLEIFWAALDILLQHLLQSIAMALAARRSGRRRSWKGASPSLPASTLLLPSPRKSIAVR